MLGGAYNDVVAAFLICPRDALDCPVAGLGTCRGEINVFGIACADELGDLSPSAVERFARFEAEPMQAGSVAEMLGEERLHGRVRFRQQRCGGLMIEENGWHCWSGEHIGIAKRGQFAILRA